jgi:glycosyltransferase involved in cell wall biosynthesis
VTLRVAIFSKVTEAHGPGGMQRHLSWLVRWLADAGAEVTIVTTRGGTGPSDMPVATIEVSGTRMGGYNAAWWRGTRRLVRDGGARAWDVIVSEDGGAWGVVEELRHVPKRPPIVMFRHGTTLRNLRQSFPPKRLRAVGSALLSLRDYIRHPRRLARHVDMMLAITEPIAASARREGAGPTTDVRVIPLGVDLERFQPSADPRIDRHTLGLDPDLPVLSWLGRDVPGKRADLALALFEHLLARGETWQMALAIGQPRPATTRRIAALRESYGPRVHVFANASEQAVLQIHRAASVQLFPSVLAEGLPITIMESLACGTPVLATPGDAFRDIDVFRERPDWIVARPSLDAWTGAARALALGPDQQDVRRVARELAERYYDLRLTARRTVRAIEDLVERWPHRR